MYLNEASHKSRQIKILNFVICTGITDICTGITDICTGITDILFENFSGVIMFTASTSISWQNFGCAVQ